ncbi:MAG: LamG domain-containing protein [Cellulomonadaceae bacterium]|nr:LamG domain-containing protein [Cellulomonadaceae bacterium]
MGRRTSWQTTYAQPDGNMRLDVTTAAVRARKNGEWVPVDSSVVAGPVGLAVAAAVTPMTFSGGDDGLPLATIERDGHTLSLDVPFDLPEPAVDGNQLTYEDVLPDVDMIVTVNSDATGFTEVLRVGSPEAATDPRLDRLTLPLKLSAGLDVVPSDGGAEARTSTGELVFAIPTPRMWDSSVAGPTGPAMRPTEGSPQDLFYGVGTRAEEVEGHRPDRAVAPLGGETVVGMPIEVSDGALSVRPDEALLTAPETTWPVYIDPGATAILNQYAAVRTVVGTKTGWSNEGVGLCSQASASDCTATFKSRLLWRFQDMGPIGALDPGNIISATFSVYGQHSYSCTPQPVSLYRVNDFNAGSVGWDGGFLALQSTVTVAHKATCAGQPDRWIEFPAAEAAQAVAGVDASVLAVGLVANEGSMAYWKRYRWDARYSVVYNRAPSSPSDVRIDNPSTPCVTGAGRPYIRSTTPTIAATLSDPDGDNLYGQFDVINLANGARVWGPRNTAAQGSGARHAAFVDSGLVDGGTYRFQVAPVDTSYGWAGSTSACEFVVDTTRPVSPTITPVPGQPAVYLEGRSAGGLGQTGSFTLAPGASADVVGFQYSFNSGSLGATVSVSPGASLTVPFTPTQYAGVQVLRVASVDRAGNVSDTRLYSFIVKFPGVWRLDEGNGTAAAGTGYTGQRFPLTVSPSTTWVGGMLAESGFSSTDKALLFDAASDVASTSGPVIATDVSYSVMAFVKADAATGTATAVSQDGTTTSQFELGLLHDASCPTSNGTCWVFGVAATDSSSPGVVRAMSTVPVQVGQWFHLVGIRRAGQIELSVCALGAGDSLLVSPQPVLSGQVPLSSTWRATGAMRVGRGFAGGSATHPWLGTVDNVQVMDGPASVGKLRTACAQVE